MADPFEEFLTAPGAATYLALRREIIAAPDFDTGSDGLRRLEALVESGDHDMVPGLLPDLMPTWLLSARTHVLLGRSAEARGESGRAKSEARLAEACMFGLKSTGDGSRERPFLPILPPDEYDLAAFLGHEVESQRREDVAGKAFDVLACADGSELWFDVTDGVIAMVRRSQTEA